VKRYDDASAYLILGAIAFVSLVVLLTYLATH
jgi:hypothetical protein